MTSFGGGCGNTETGAVIARITPSIISWIHDTAKKSHCKINPTDLICLRPANSDCQDGYKMNNSTCIDIDECSLGDVCGLGADCENIDGGHYCHCKSGFQINQMGICDDINECELGMFN